MKPKDVARRIMTSRITRLVLLVVGLALLYFGWALDHIDQNSWLLQFAARDYLRVEAAYKILVDGKTTLSSPSSGFEELGDLLKGHLVVQGELPLTETVDPQYIEVLSIRAQGEVPWLVTTGGYSGPGIAGLEVVVQYAGQPPQTIGPSDFPGLSAEIGARYLTHVVFGYSSSFFLAGLAITLLAGLVEILRAGLAKLPGSKATRRLPSWTGKQWFQLSIAALSFGAILAILLTAFAITLGLQEDTRASVLATIGTGLALLLVTSIALGLDFARYRRSQEPLLGVMWKERGVYPLTEHASAEPEGFYVEHVLWNAGSTPVLVLQPGSVSVRGIASHSLSTERNELLLLRGSAWEQEKAFPVILAESETAIWRFYPGDKAVLPPTMGQTIDRDMTKAVAFIKKNKKDRCFLFGLTYFSALPQDVQKKDLRKCFVGFTYDVDKETEDPGQS